MSIFCAYKTKGDVIVVVVIQVDNKGAIKISTLDHNIPPSPAELIGVFQADTVYDYINCMLPALLSNLKEDPEVVKIYEKIQQEET